MDFSTTADMDQPHAAPPAHSPIHTGVTLGRYQVREPLGAGLHGPTFRACDPHLGRWAVVEVLEPAAAECLAGAAEAIVRLRHQNLVGVYEVGETDGVPYVVTAHVEALPLSAAGAGDSFRVLHGVARGLDHVHAEGLVHGDVRLAAVLLGPGGAPLLRGAGLAPLLGEGEMAPEADRRAFAALAYELVTGGRPFASPAAARE